MDMASSGLNNLPAATSHAADEIIMLNLALGDCSPLSPQCFFQEAVWRQWTLQNSFVQKYKRSQTFGFRSDDLAGHSIASIPSAIRWSCSPYCSGVGHVLSCIRIHNIFPLSEVCTHECCFLVSTRFDCSSQRLLWSLLMQRGHIMTWRKVYGKFPSIACIWLKVIVKNLEWNIKIFTFS